MFRLILLLTGLILLSAEMQGQLGYSQKATFKKGIFVSAGVGHMQEWKHSDIQLVTPTSVMELTSPNSATVYGLSLGYMQKKGWYGQFSYDWEYTVENDINAKLWLRALHFSIGKEVYWAGERIRFFTGFSSIQEITLLHSITTLPSLKVTFSEGTRAGNLYLHLGGDFLLRVTKSVQAGFRLKAISNFNHFGRYDLSWVVSYNF